MRVLKRFFGSRARKRSPAGFFPIVCCVAVALILMGSASQALATPGTWPIKPQPSAKGQHPPDPNLARVGLARAVVSAIHAEQALLQGRMDLALKHVKSVRAALKQAQSKGTPWQKKALTRLDHVANQLQYHLKTANPAAFNEADALVASAMKAQESFKQATSAKAHSKAKAKTAKKSETSHKKAQPKPHPKPKTEQRPNFAPPTPFLQDIPNKPIDPTMDEEHPGTLARPGA